MESHGPPGGTRATEQGRLVGGVGAGSLDFILKDVSWRVVEGKWHGPLCILKTSLWRNKQYQKM